MDDLAQIRALMSVRPPTPEVVAEGRARLTAAFQEPLRETVSREPVLPEPTVGRIRRAIRAARWTALGAGLLGVAATTAVVLSQGAPDPAPTRSVATLSAKDVFLAAANSTVKMPTTGKYWVRKAVNGRRLDSPDKRYRLVKTTAVESWVPRAPGGRAWTITQEQGIVPATPEDEKAWRAAGSPRSWTYPDRKITLHAEPGERQAVWNDTGKPMTLLDTPMTPQALKALPTTPEGMRTYLEKVVADGYGAEPVNMNANVFQYGTQLVMDFPVSAEVRAAVYRMCAVLPGVKSLGTVTDPLGRTGQAVGFQEGAAARTRFVLDTATGRPLASESANSYRGELIESYAAVSSLTWTDEEPDLPTKQSPQDRPAD
ncbi:CU044_5270 family protein [Streptosporangium sp. NPDC020072]|uniref:CU044_5270 family protein n=1 Tax=Streptosporangium sp. NPDC020072 TaxID=3154788 RepID=UPI0034339D4C